MVTGTCMIKSADRSEMPFHSSALETRTLVQRHNSQFFLDYLDNTEFLEASLSATHLEVILSDVLS